MERLIRTQEAAKICQVSQGTVIRWINEGRLRASVTAGGHNRVLMSDLIVFLKTLNFPIPSELVKESRKRVLIVDDESEIRKMIRWMLENNFENIAIEEADDGFTAGWTTRHFQPDLVVLDLLLPGLDGYHVCEFIRNFPELAGVKIIAITALNNPEVEKKFLELGADTFFVKPFDLDEMKNKISGLLHISERNGKHA